MYKDLEEHNCLFTLPHPGGIMAGGSNIFTLVSDAPK